MNPYDFARFALDADTKVTRSAFLYLEPKPRDSAEEFAQCSSCRMFVPKVEGLNGSRCIIHGSKVEVSPGATCGLYVDWPTGKPNQQVVDNHAAELAKDIAGSVTPQESGLVNMKVQCHRCSFAEEEATICGLYRKLNSMDLGKFDENIKPHACCNAWTAS